MQTIKATDPACVETTVQAIKAGGLVIYPTETVYGAGVDATNFEAVKKLTAYKNRPFGKPYSIAVTDQTMASVYVDINEGAKKIYRRFLPGPVTVVSQGLHKTAPGVESETGTLGIRIPDYPLIIDIVKTLGCPITATSANASYKKRPYKIADILDNLSAKQKALIDLIVDAGTLPPNEPSTVIDTTFGKPTALRIGGVKLSSKNVLLSKSEENTQNIGKELYQKFAHYLGTRAIIFALTGEMGTGKTAFTKGVARAMGITEEVTSPTYDLVNHYGSLVHMDTWRLENLEEFEGLGLEEIIHDKSVVVIEWADRVADIIRQYNEEAIVIWVKIEYKDKQNEREISWENK